MDLLLEDFGHVLVVVIGFSLFYGSKYFLKELQSRGIIDHPVDKALNAQITNLINQISAKLEEKLEKGKILKYREVYYDIDDPVVRKYLKKRNKVNEVKSEYMNAKTSLTEEWDSIINPLSQHSRDIFLYVGFSAFYYLLLSSMHRIIEEQTTIALLNTYIFCSVIIVTLICNGIIKKRISVLIWFVVAVALSIIGCLIFIKYYEQFYYLHPTTSIIIAISLILIAWVAYCIIYLGLSAGFKTRYSQLHAATRERLTKIDIFLDEDSEGENSPV